MRPLLRLFFVLLTALPALLITTPANSGVADAVPVPVRGPNLAFYYGSAPPVGELRHFDQVVVQPNQLQAHERTALLASGPLMLAYVSVGEVARSSIEFPNVDARWLIGENTGWNSVIMDLANPAWRNYLLEQHFAPLWQQGYRGFFLDTMDSYAMVTKAGPERTRQEAGLRELLRSLKNQFTGVQLTVNRGFDVLEGAHEFVDGFVVEAYFHGWDPAAQKLTDISEESRGYLRKLLDKVQNTYRIPVTVVDYVMPGQWQIAEEHARKIIADGYTPWVANGDLNMLGQGRYRVIPRRVLALYDGPLDHLPEAEVFRYLAVPLEQLGYAVDFLNIENESLPLEPLAGRYAGVVSWLSERSLGWQPGLCARLQKEAGAGVRTAFFGAPPDGELCESWLQIGRNQRLANAALQLQFQHSAVGHFEAPLRLRSRDLVDVYSRSAAQSWLRLQDSSGAIFDPIVVADFGGWALQPYALNKPEQAAASWLVDPLAFLREALQLSELPQADVSMENGKRTAITVLHSDGLGAQMGNGQSVLSAWQGLLKTYQQPFTLALTEAELNGSATPEAEQKQRLQAVQDLLKLPGAELAAHSYSHPYSWRVFDGHNDSANLRHLYTLPQKDYLADLTREIVTPSSTLAQLFGRPVQVLVWPGDAQPGPAASQLAHAAGLLQFGGGGSWLTRSSGVRPLLKSLNEHETTVAANKSGANKNTVKKAADKKSPDNKDRSGREFNERDFIGREASGPRGVGAAASLTEISPLLRAHRYGIQVLAPLLNENRYAEIFNSTALNYREVLAQNRALQFYHRPWSLQFHLDALLRPEGMTVVADMLQATVQADLTHLSVAQYGARVIGAHSFSFARDLNRQWRVLADGVQTLRWPASMPLDFERSEGINAHAGEYLFLGNGPLRLQEVVLANKPESKPSNAPENKPLSKVPSTPIIRIGLQQNQACLARADAREWSLACP